MVWDQSDDTALQTQDFHIYLWWPQAEHATNRGSQQNWIFESVQRNIFLFLQPEYQSGGGGLNRHAPT